MPKNPYTYINKPDGAEVGKYSPIYTLTKPRSKGVTKDLFLDNRDPKNITLPVQPEVKYPDCTLNGSIYCNLGVRTQVRVSPDGKRSKFDFRTPAPKLLEGEELQNTLPAPNEQEESSVKTEERLARLAFSEQRKEPKQQRNLFASLDSPLGKIRAFESQINRDHPKVLFNGIHPGRVMWHQRFYQRNSQHKRLNSTHAASKKNTITIDQRAPMDYSSNTSHLSRGVNSFGGGFVGKQGPTTAGIKSK